MPTRVAPDKSGAQPSGAASKVLDVLEQVVQHPEGLALNVLSRDMGIVPSTAFRVARIATRAGFLVQGGDKRYRVGPRLRALALRAVGDLDLRRVARPVLVALHQRCQETVHLSVLERGQVVDVDAIESDHAVKVCSTVGRTIPMHCTSTGKVLLAYRPESEAVLLLEVAGMPRHTDRTKTSPADLLPELAAIRAHGWALDEEEHERCVVCIAAPIRNALGDVCAAVGISGLKWNMDAHGHDLVRQLVREAANEISHALGAPVPEADASAV